MLWHACIVCCCCYCCKVTRYRREWPKPGNDWKSSCQTNKARPANIHAPSSPIEDVRIASGCSRKSCRNCMRPRMRTEGGGRLGWRTSWGRREPADTAREGHCRDRAEDEYYLVYLLQTHPLDFLARLSSVRASVDSRDTRQPRWSAARLN